YLLNPGAEEIHNISVYDLTGRLILESADANRKSYTINRPGNYVVVVKTARTIHTNKILITAN
ncbi:MAG: T9SS type A sorting domain-containing protein, partial [bacterium]